MARFPTGCEDQGPLAASHSEGCRLLGLGESTKVHKWHLHWRCLESQVQVAPNHENFRGCAPDTEPPIPPQG